MAWSFDPSAKLPLPPAWLIDPLRNDDFVIASSAAAGGGVRGAQKPRLVFPKHEIRFDCRRGDRRDLVSGVA